MPLGNADPAAPPLRTEAPGGAAPASKAPLKSSVTDALDALTRADWRSQGPQGELWRAIKAAGSAGRRGNNKTHILAGCKSLIRGQGFNPDAAPDGVVRSSPALREATCGQRGEGSVGTTTPR